MVMLLIIDQELVYDDHCFHGTDDLSGVRVLVSITCIIAVNIQMFINSYPADHEYFLL